MELLGIGTSGAKIILIGEHAVVHYKPAIAIPFNGLETKVEVFKSSDEITIDCMYHKGYLKDGDNIINGIKMLVERVLSTLKINNYGIHLKITSNIISQRGLGSSAAVSVAVVKALYDAFNKELKENILIDHAMYAEKIHHTNPSGLDVYTLVYQRPIWYVKNEGFKPLKLNLSATILIIDSGMMSQTRIAVEHVGKLYLENKENTQIIFDEIEKLTNKALIEIENNLINDLEETLYNGQKALKALEISNDTTDHIINKVNNKGIKGAKITGGGMGGCIIAVTKDHRLALKVQSELLNEGIPNVWLYQLK